MNLRGRRNVSLDRETILTAWFVLVVVCLTLVPFSCLLSCYY